MVAACGAAPAALPSQSPTASSAPSPSAAGIAPAALAFDGAKSREHLAYLADPARGGRWSGSPGYEDAARYVAERFREIGLEPLGDGGTYFQRFTMRIVDLAGTPTLSRTGADAKTWTHRADFTESVGGRAGGGAAEGALAVVGGASTAGGMDDFAGVDVRGRIAMITGPSDRGYLDSVVQRGAAGALIVGDSSLKYSYIARFFGQTIPVIVVNERTADELLAPAGRTVSQVRDAVRARRADPGAPPTAFVVDAPLRMSVPLTPVREVQATNVVGLLRATGPDAARAVLVGGHLDGVGTDPNGTVFPAANDNASGPAIAIEVARALAARKDELRRSIVFAAFAGEEQGYLGSEAYVTKVAGSPGRVESLVAMLNLDVIGCCGSTLQASNESSALVERFRRAAERAGVPFESTGGGGSDQETFAKRGVPATLVHWNNYVLHTTTDTADRVDVAHLQKAGDVVTAVALELGRGADP